MNSVRHVCIVFEDLTWSGLYDLETFKEHTDCSASVKVKIEGS